MSDIDIDIDYEGVGACLGLEGNSLLDRGRAPLIFQGVVLDVLDIGKVNILPEVFYIFYNCVFVIS